MTRKPEEFADPPAWIGNVAGGSDALSDLLYAVRLRGDTVIRCAPSPADTKEVAAGTRVLHIVERGQVQINIAGRSLPVRRGELVLLACGEPHSIQPRPAGPRDQPMEVDHAERATDGGATAWVTGTFAVEDSVAGPLLAVLPPAIVIGNNRPDRTWLEISLQLLLAEVTEPRPGGHVMISRILDLLFIHALREWSTSGEQSSPGWLTAAMDPALGPVLTAVHRDPGRRWTVTELAHRAQLSRSSFAERFTRLLGQSPAAYVTERNLDHAAHLLGSTKQPVRQIAAQVGYTSEAAFSRAFNRRFGTPPLRWRKADQSRPSTGEDPTKRS